MMEIQIIFCLTLAVEFLLIEVNSLSINNNRSKQKQKVLIIFFHCGINVLCSGLSKLYIQIWIPSIQMHSIWEYEYEDLKIYEISKIQLYSTLCVCLSIFSLSPLSPSYLSSFLLRLPTNYSCLLSIHLCPPTVLHRGLSHSFDVMQI